jgi:hypothetical protein
MTRIRAVSWFGTRLNANTSYLARIRVPVSNIAPLLQPHRPKSVLNSAHESKSLKGEVLVSRLVSLLPASDQDLRSAYGLIR